jgi:hypothetical protein
MKKPFAVLRCIESSNSSDVKTVQIANLDYDTAERIYLSSSNKVEDIHNPRVSNFLNTLIDYKMQIPVKARSSDE